MTRPGRLPAACRRCRHTVAPRSTTPRVACPDPCPSPYPPPGQQLLFSTPVQSPTATEVQVCSERHRKGRGQTQHLGGVEGEECHPCPQPEMRLGGAWRACPVHGVHFGAVSPCLQRHAGRWPVPPTFPHACGLPPMRQPLQHSLGSWLHTPPHCCRSLAEGGMSAQVRASHLLVKHRDSRRPSSWKEATVTRSPEEALAMVQQVGAQAHAAWPMHTCRGGRQQGHASGSCSQQLLASPRPFCCPPSHLLPHAVPAADCSGA